MNPSHTPEKGEVLKLGPPASGEVIITVDPGSTGTAFTAGIRTLLPGAEYPVQKHLHRDTVLFVHKGQARATLNERVIVVVPGAMLYVPRGAWHGLRNTGTGTLQIAWASAPPGLELFFRDLSRAGVSPSVQVLQELAQRHGIEFGQAAPPAGGVPAGRRHRGRRGGRRNRGGRVPARSDSSGSTAIPSSAPMEPSSAMPPVAPVVSAAPSAASVAPTAVGAPRGHRRRRGRGARPRSTSPAAPAQQSSRPAAGRQRPPRGRHRRRVREVYMGGRWIQVEGEGPVIAPGSDRSERRGPKPDGDDEPPAIRLSVPL